MGAGEIILTCVDKDGTNEGFDYEIIKRIKKNIYSNNCIRRSGKI